ncbi:MAG: hypothetical protein WC908_00470 [Candidatus Paceibacterota bacterium]
MKTNKGFALIALLAIIVGVLVVGGGAYFLGKSKGEDKKVEEIPKTENQIKGQNKFVFNKNQDRTNKLYFASVDGEKILLGTEVKVKREKLESSKDYSYSFMPKDVLGSMKLSEGMTFYSAVQSMDDDNLWIFVERDMNNLNYSLYFYNHQTKMKEFIFSQNKTPDPRYSFIPFTWNGDIVYLEAKEFGSATENEGIWSYNIKTKQFSKIPINPLYLATPIISPDGKYFIYIGTTEDKGEYSSPDIIYIYDLATNQEKIIEKDNNDINSSYMIWGWVNGEINNSELIDINQ